MTKMIKVQAMLEWRAEKGDAANRWVAFCDALGISTEGATLDEIHELIPEAMHLLMIDLLEDDEFDNFLRERGWEATSVQSGDDDVEFDVPWQLIAEGANGFERTSH